MIWSKILNSEFIQQIIKVVLGLLVFLGLVKAIRKDAADDKEVEIEADNAQDALEIVKEAKAVHEEVNNYSDDDHIDLLQK